MLLTDMKAFYRWLEEAQEEELIKKLDNLAALKLKVTNENVTADANYLLRHIEDELLVRAMKK